jgi:hypothetical protein
MGTEAERRRAAVQAYRERPRTAGVYRILNTVSGRFLLGSRLNLDGALNSHRFALTHGSHRNALLQKEWNEHGAEAFTFEVLEVVKVKDEPEFDVEAELSLLEEIWIEELRPSPARAYNETGRIRQV